MEVSVESGEGLERRMTVGLESERIHAEVEKRLLELSRSARMPGFRPGKVPVKILRQRYGAQMRQEVFGELMQESFSEALSQEELLPAGAPQIEPDVDESANRYAYTAVFEVLPQFELSGLEGKNINRPTAEVTDSDLDRMLERLRDQRKTWQSVERSAQSGDKLKLSFTGTLEGEPFEGGSAEDSEIVLGLGRMIPGFEDGLLGAQAGDERHLDLIFPEEYPVDNLKGKPVAFDVRIAEVSEPVLPALDADFAKALGFEDGDLERFRADVRQNMERELKQRIQDRVKQRVMDLLLEVNQIDLPDVLIGKEIEAIKEQARRGVAGGQFELPDDLFREQARRRVALGLIIAEVVKVNGIEIDSQRVREAVEEMASTYEQPQQVIDYYYGDEKRLASVESLTLENQVVDWVLDQVTVVDEPTTFDDINAASASD